MCEKTNKNLWWQFVRGICIIAVVQIHCASAIGAPFVSIDNTYYFFIRSLLSFPVAVFFYLSGRFTKLPEYGEGNYAKKRLLKLAIPYVIWTTIYIIFSMICRQRMSIGDILLKYINGSAAMPLYYILVLMYFTILSSILFKTIDVKLVKYFILFISFLIEIVAYYCSNIGLDIQWVKFSPIWLPFYYFGILAGQKKINFLRLKKRYVLGALLFSYIVQLLEGYILLNIPNCTGLAWSQWHISAFCYSVAAICFFETMSSFVPKETNYVVRIGNISFGIFFVHCLFISIIAFVFNKLGIGLVLPLRRIIQLVFSLMASIVTIKIITFFLPGKYTKKYMGL